MLAVVVTDAAPPAASVPDDLRPRRMFPAEQILTAPPEPGGFGWRDLAAPSDEQLLDTSTNPCND